MLVYKNQLLGAKSLGKGSRSESGLIVIAGCNIENLKLS
jgi:hypothetical protein